MRNQEALPAIRRTRTALLKLQKHDEILKKIRPLSGGQGWLRPQRSFTGCGEGMIMQSLKRSLRFRWSSSQMEANLEASDLTATELPPTYLRAFHSLIALDSSSTFLLSWFSFERPAATSADPEKRSCSTANLALRQKKHTSSLLVFATGFFSNVV